MTSQLQNNAKINRVFEIKEEMKKTDGNVRESVVRHGELMGENNTLLRELDADGINFRWNKEENGFDVYLDKRTIIRYANEG